MGAGVPGLLADLAGEAQVTEALLVPLGEGAWDRATRAAGWAVRDQVSHLAYFDEAATLAAADPDRFRADAAALMALGSAFPDEIARRYRGMPADALLAWFRRARGGFVSAFRAIDPPARPPWYGPEMSAASSGTARLMETWAPGPDTPGAP